MTKITLKDEKYYAKKQLGIPLGCNQFILKTKLVSNDSQNQKKIFCKKTILLTSKADRIVQKDKYIRKEIEININWRIIIVLTLSFAIKRTYNRFRGALIRRGCDLSK